MNADQIPAFIALRLRDVASFNGCVGTRDGVCIEREPDNPVEWCKYCVQGQAARIIERHIEGRAACADQPWQPIETHDGSMNPVLVCEAHGFQCTAQFMDGRWEPWAPAFYKIAPTHWRPLPAPPSPAAKET